MTSTEYLDRNHGIFEIRGAAGSGKTYQLVQDIKYLHEKNKKVGPRIKSVQVK